MRFRYPVLARGLIAAPVLMGGAFMIFGISIARVEPWYALLVGGVGLIVVFVGVFQLPVEIETTPENILVRYLFGFTQSFSRADLKVSRIGFSPGTLLLQATDSSWRSRLTGSFKINLAFIPNSQGLLEEFPEIDGA